jgi:hypothetical protein
MRQPRLASQPCGKVQQALKKGVGGVEKLYSSQCTVRRTQGEKLNIAHALNQGLPSFLIGDSTNNLQSNMHANGDPYHPI